MADDKEKPKTVKKEKPKTVELTRTAFIILVVLAAGGMYLVYALSKNQVEDVALKGEKVVGVGDVVVINFISRTEDKKIVDTSYVDVAKAEGIYNSERTYRPITFTIGSGELLDGIEKGVVGMADGERKTILVSPENGFGEYNPQLLQVAPKIYPVDRIRSIPIERYSSVVSSEPVPNSTVVDPNIPWPMLILNVSNETVSIKYSPEEGLVFQSILGLAQVVAVLEDQILIEEKPVNGSIISTAGGPARVYDLNDTAILLDYNHPLAGKTLLYELKVEGIVKTNKSG